MTDAFKGPVNGRSQLLSASSQFFRHFPKVGKKERFPFSSQCGEKLDGLLYPEVLYTNFF